MFERFTEKAKRSIFFARYEASQYGSPYIETEHVLLGLLRENRDLTRAVLPSKTSIDAIRKQIDEQKPRREKTSTSVDLPLSNESKRVLSYAAAEAESLQSKHIGSQHLLLGLLREKAAFAAQLLNSQGLSLDRTREVVAKWQTTPEAAHDLVTSTRNPGRFAGLLYVLMSIPGFFALIFVPSKLIVHGSATATANNIAASETLFRLGIACNLIGQAGFIFVALALYELLKGVNQRQAVLMVTLIVVAIPIAFLNELNAIAALILVRGADFLAILEKPQRDALVMLFLNLHGYGFDVAGIFWGLWLFPLGLLAYRSGFIPRILGVLVMLNGFTYPVNSFTSLVLPQYEHIVSRWMMPLSFGELVFMFWLLIMGAKPKPLASQASSAAVG